MTTYHRPAKMSRRYSSLIHSVLVRIPSPYYSVNPKVTCCHSEPEPFTSFRINSAEAKSVLSQAEGNLVAYITGHSFANKNEIVPCDFVLRLCSGQAQDRRRFAPQNANPSQSS
jgi:hypothetical protein